MLRCRFSHIRVFVVKPAIQDFFGHFCQPIISLNHSPLQSLKEESMINNYTPENSSNTHEIIFPTLKHKGDRNTSCFDNSKFVLFVENSIAPVKSQSSFSRYTFLTDLTDL